MTMNIPHDIDDYIKESIDYSMGLPISDQTLKLKLQVFEDANKRIKDQYFLVVSRLKGKDDAIERARAEASMNAQALKNFIEQNQKLATECGNLVCECAKWKKECSLYDRDREALMDFGNEADNRARESESRVCKLELEVQKLTEELQVYKHEAKQHVGDLSDESTIMERQLLESVVKSLPIREDITSGALGFLEANSNEKSCQTLLKMWKRLKPSTQNVLSLAAEIKALQKDKEHLRINLNTAEEEVKILYEDNKILDEENKRWMQFHKDTSQPGSTGKHTDSTTSAKSNKRKSSSKMSSPIGKKIEFNEDSPRQVLSPFIAVHTP